MIMVSMLWVEGIAQKGTQEVIKESKGNRNKKSMKMILII